MWQMQMMVYKLHQEGLSGAQKVFDIAPQYLLPKSTADLLKRIIIMRNPRKKCGDIPFGGYCYPNLILASSSAFSATSMTILC